MVLYHVFIEHYVEGRTEKTSGLFANISEKMVEVNFTQPYNDDESFEWFDNIIDNVMVTRIHVFGSFKPIHQILLPDGNNAGKSEPNITVSSFLSGEVKDVYNATDDFVKLLTAKDPYTTNYIPKEMKKRVWTHRAGPIDRRIY
jgi:hypothetical protein